MVRGAAHDDGAGPPRERWRRDRCYDQESGRFTQEDPIGLAGGLNLYGYAGGDPINSSDPFGLCKKKRSDGKKCTDKTGDSNLDNPDSRQHMEDAYNDAPDDGDGLKREIGGSCDEALNCQTATGDPKKVGVPIVDGAIFEFHGHPNEGVVFGRSGQYTVFEKPARPSQDVDLASIVSERSAIPMYVVGKDHIWAVRYDPNSATGYTIQEYKRFK